MKRSKSQTFPVRKKGSNSCDNPHRKVPEGMKPGHFRSKSKIKLLNLYRSKPDLAKMKERPTEPVRIQPDRRWFNNTRVITQKRLDELRDAVAAEKSDPYLVQLKASKLPVSLFNDAAAAKQQRKRQRTSGLLAMESYEKTFGKKSQRKRVRMDAENLSDLATAVDESHNRYDEEKDFLSSRYAAEEEAATFTEGVFKKGKSRRIWGELYKVVDSSDVIVQVLDARDPEGTRCKFLERHIREDRPHKKLVLLLNKCDLIPSRVAARWTKILSSQAPTIAFHSSVTNPFGKMTLINLLRQFASLMKERKHVSVGFIGYPNVGKSSVINTLRSKEVCKTAPVPGETKIWQYVALTNRVYLIDCPGVVPGDAEAGDYTDKVLKGVVRAERVQDPDCYIPAILQRVQPEALKKRYKIEGDWENPEDFLSKLALKMGKLLKGGDPDVRATSKIVIFDWQRGRLPFFTPPPRWDDDVQDEAKTFLKS